MPMHRSVPRMPQLEDQRVPSDCQPQQSVALPRANQEHRVAQRPQQRQQEQAQSEQMMQQQAMLDPPQPSRRGQPSLRHCGDR